MGDETLKATKGYLQVVRWVDPTIQLDAYIEQRTLDVGGDTTVAADFMSAEGETKGLVDIAVEADLGFAGICLSPNSPADGYDLDDVIVDGTIVDILRPTGHRTIVACILDSTATTSADIEEFDWVRIGSTAGHVEKWVYNDAADSTDSFSIVVGKSYEVMANHTADDRVFHIWY